MCGGFVLGQVADRLAGVPAARMCERSRIGSGALIPYHLGRIVTYAALGGAVGLGGAAVAGVPWLTGGLLMLAAGVFLLMAWRRGMGLTGRLAFLAGPRGGTATGAEPRVIVRRVTGQGMRTEAAPQRPVRGTMDDGGWRPLHSLRGFPLGLMLGFLPCGFVYAGLAAAAAGGDPLAGAIGMAAFGAGTMPVLIAIGIAGHSAGQRWQAAIAAAAPFVLVVNAALLMLLALKGLAA